MATIPLSERRAACDTLCRLVGEDAYSGGRFLNFLNQGLSGNFSWPTVLRERARLWAPYIASGLSIEEFVNEIERYAAIIAQQ